MIQVQNVHMRYPIQKRYREHLLHPLRKRERFTALRGADLEIETGERLALLGPNGAGKTTLLKLIGGLILPSEGRIEVNGHDTLKENTAARKTVGFMINDERSFYWRLTGRQNLEFFGALDDLFGPELRTKIEELVDLVGLNEAADKPVSNYSSGMRQRLAMARALLCEPEILILDEPTRTLDPVAAEDLVELILERLHRDAQRTLLIATHRLEEAEKLCDRVCIVRQGRIVADEKLEALRARGEALGRYYRKIVEAPQPA